MVCEGGAPRLSRELVGEQLRCCDGQVHHDIGDIVHDRRHPRLADRNGRIIDDRDQAAEMVFVLTSADDQIDTAWPVAEDLIELLQDMISGIPACSDAGVGQNLHVAAAHVERQQDGRGQLHLEQVELNVGHSPSGIAPGMGDLGPRTTDQAQRSEANADAQIVYNPAQSDCFSSAATARLRIRRKPCLHC